MRPIFTLFAIVFLLVGNSQIKVDETLLPKLTSKTTFNDVWNTVYTHYTNKNLDSNKIANREFKKWNRWAWWAARNLDKDGKIMQNDNEVLRAFKSINDTHKNDRSNTGSWQPLTTNSFTYSAGNIVGTGRVDRVIFHPTDVNMLYVASSGGGLWRSFDGGGSWTCITNNLPNCGVTGVALDESDPTGNTIIIATGDGDTGGSNYFVTSFQFKKRSFGILKTTDGGATWSLLGNSQNTMDFRNPYKLVKLKGFPDRYLCATTSGFLKSSTNGVTWDLIGSGTPYFDIEQDPDNNNIVFLSYGSGITISTDGGLTFTNISTASFTPAIGVNAKRSALAFNLTNADELYFLLVDAPTNEILYKSVDGGASFNLVLNNADICDQCDVYMAPIAVNGSNVLTGGVNLFRSTNNGTSFSNSTQWYATSTSNPQYIHADIHDLAFNPLSNKLYGATDGGLFVSNDSGNSWSHISNGLNTLQFYHLDGLDGAANTFVGGFQDNGTALTTNSGTSLNFFGYGDGYQPKFVPTQSNIIYYGCNKFLVRYNSSTNTNVNITSDISWFPKIAVHPSNNQIAYFGFASNIYRTTNQGTNLYIVSNFGASNNAASHAGGLATTEAGPDYVYAADATNVRKSTDQGSNWSTISGNAGWATQFSAITDIATCNTNQDMLYVATNSATTDKVLFTQDGGSTWINLTGSLPSEARVYSVAVHNNGDAYIGTNMGIFYQGISMSDWVPYMNGMPLVEVSDLFINEAANKITASTFGRGLWQSDLYTDCLLNLNLGGIVNGVNKYQASSTITSNQWLSSNYGNSLSYKASSRITLQPGFKIAEGAYFHGQMGPCGQGVFVTSPKKVFAADKQK